MIDCSSCAEKNLPDTARFCGRCGRLLSASNSQDLPTLIEVETLSDDEIGLQTIVGRKRPDLQDQLHRFHVKKGQGHVR